MKRAHCRNCKHMVAIARDGRVKYVHCPYTRLKFSSISEFLEYPATRGVKCPLYCLYYEKEEKKK